MKSTMMLMALGLSGNVLAQSAPAFRVLERMAQSNRTYYHQVELEDLQSADAFEGKHFKIVQGKENAPISFSADAATVVKAATVYHHLTKARRFWVDKLHIERVAAAPQLTVRLEITNLFDEQGHFANDKKDPQYNNALSVPRGKTPDWVPVERQDAWGSEIWFRPMKKIETKKLPSLGANPLTTTLQAVERPFLNYTQNRFAQSIMEHVFYPTYASTSLLSEVVRYAGTIAMTKAVIEASKHMDSLFAEKYYYLDTAMVPEVIYHEYAHVVLSDNLELTHSTPVVEGMADYFAAVQASKKRIYARVRGFSNATPKEPDNDRNLYNHWYESNAQATADFVLSVLWDVREALGPEFGDKVVYDARTTLRTSTARINSHLIQAILDSCKRNCQNPRADQLLLYETFRKKGF